MSLASLGKSFLSKASAMSFWDEDTAMSRKDPIRETVRTSLSNLTTCAVGKVVESASLTPKFVSGLHCPGRGREVSTPRGGGHHSSVRAWHMNLALHPVRTLVGHHTVGALVLSFPVRALTRPTGPLALVRLCKSVPRCRGTLCDPSPAGEKNFFLLDFFETLEEKDEEEYESKTTTLRVESSIEGPGPDNCGARLDGVCDWEAATWVAISDRSSPKICSLWPGSLSFGASSGTRPSWS